VVDVVAGVDDVPEFGFVPALPPPPPQAVKLNAMQLAAIIFKNFICFSLNNLKIKPWFSELRLCQKPFLA
jgi:hypothetical protein